MVGAPASQVAQEPVPFIFCGIGSSAGARRCTSMCYVQPAGDHAATRLLAGPSATLRRVPGTPVTVVYQQCRAALDRSGTDAGSFATYGLKAELGCHWAAVPQRRTIAWSGRLENGRDRGIEGGRVWIFAPQRDMRSVALGIGRYFRSAANPCDVFLILHRLGIRYCHHYRPSGAWDRRHFEPTVAVSRRAPTVTLFYLGNSARR